jgi:hypothetical protein
VLAHRWPHLPAERERAVAAAEDAADDLSDHVAVLLGRDPDEVLDRGVLAEHGLDLLERQQLSELGRLLPISR